MIDSPADVVVVVAMASRGAETLLVSQRERERRKGDNVCLLSLSWMAPT